MANKVINQNQDSIETLEERRIYGELDEKAVAREKSVTRLRLVWSQRQFIFRVAAVGLVFSTLIAFVIPTRYQSVARLMPPDQINPSMAMLSMATGARGGAAGSDLGSSVGSALGPSLGALAGDILGLKSTGALLVGVLQSQTVEDDLINKFNLKKLYWDRHIEDARIDLEDKTDVEEDRKSGIVVLKVTDKNPSRAAAMTREYVDQLNRVLALVNTSSAHRERVFLEGRLTQVKQDLETAEKDFSNFASKNTALDVPTQGKAMIEAAATLEGELVAAQTELEGLKQIYADGNVRVRATRARVDELRQQLGKLGGTSDLSQPRGQDAASTYPSIRQLPLLGVSYADYYRNAKIQEAIFDTLTQEYELAKVQEAKETPTVKVLDEPQIPDKKSFPPRLLIMSLGTVFAFCAGMTWIFAHERWENTEPTDARKIFAREVFGVLTARMGGASRNGSGGGAPSAEESSRANSGKGSTASRD